MKENVGSFDRAWRFAVGPALVAYGLSRRGRRGGLLATVAGALLTQSAVTRVCPLYRSLGIDTLRRPVTEPAPRFEESESTGSIFLGVEL